MDKTGTVGKKWLVNELVLSFWAFKRFAKFQSNPIIFWKVIVLTEDNDNDRLTDRPKDIVVKNIFSHSGGFKT